jgi:hypothetical protein
LILIETGRNETLLLILLLVYVLGVIVIQCSLKCLDLKKLVYEAYGDISDIDKMVKILVIVVPLIWPMILFVKISDEERKLINECKKDDKE